jgi:ribosomal protein S18 acetylase RimI-like enzyme
MHCSEVNAPCELLAWDSAFFGRRIARVTGHRLNPDRLAGIQDWCVRQEIDCLYFLADADHDETVTLAEQNDFHLVDVRLTFMRTLFTPASFQTTEPDAGQAVEIRPAHASDIASLETIARTAHADTRFYYDRQFAASQCAHLYATWIRRSYEGFASQVLVAETDVRAVGYITCTLDSGNATLGQIGLVGVDGSARGRGVGPALLRGSLQWFVDQGVQQVRVVTQGRNVTAQRMYQRCGFVTHSVQMWYHRWFPMHRLLTSP